MVNKKLKKVVKPLIFFEDSEIYFKSKGRMEYIVGYLYDKVKSCFEIDCDLKLPVKTTNVIIKRYSGLFEEAHKEGKKKFWGLSLKGKLFVESEIKSKKLHEKNQEELLRTERERNMSFEMDFLDLIKSLKIDINSKDSFLELDFKEFSKFDPIFCDKFLEDYEMMKEEFIHFVFERYNVRKKLRPIGLPESLRKNFSDLSPLDLNKLIKTRAVIEFRSDTIEGSALESTFRCRSCSEEVVVKQNGDFYDKPCKCLVCGSKDKFSLVSERHTGFLELIVRNKDITKTRTMMHLELEGDDLIDYLNKHLGNNKSVEISGIFRAKQKFKSKSALNRFLYYIKAENIKAIDDLGKVKLSKEDLNEFKKISDDVTKNGLKNITNIVFPSSISVHIGQSVLNEGWILQLISGKNVCDKSGVKERNKPHIFCMGDPATDKSRKISFIQKVDSRVRDVNGSSTSSAGLLLGMQTFEDKKFVSGGVLAEANNSIVIIDEIQKFDNDARGSLHDVLASQRLKYNKVGFNIEEDVDISMSFFGNPIGDSFNSGSAYRQIVNPSDKFGRIDSNLAFLSRCDLVICIRDIKSEEKDLEIINVKLNKLTKKNFSFEMIKKYLNYVKDLKQPRLSMEAQELLKQIIPVLRSRISEYNVTMRVLEVYQIFSSCFAKLRLSNVIEEIDIIRTHKLYMDSLESLDVNIPVDVRQLDFLEKKK